KPLKSIEDKILSNERIYTYIVDNDGFANSDKRFATNLKSENGTYLHNELSPYIDNHGAMNLSKIEQVYESKEEDEIQSYFNEWNEEIQGKKYGYIQLKEILEKKTIKYAKININTVKNTLWEELNNKNLLSEETHEILKNLAPLDKSGNYKKFSVSDFIDNGELLEEYSIVFEELGLEYDSENNKYYDLKEEEITYALPLVPEKYLRKKEIVEITLNNLERVILDVEEELKKLIEDK
ncbi:MAG: hypothetical protein RBR65_09465, partial [Aliarcobacter sp.]|nr:hypothetical protein [Aliarcobacter sp.]